VSDGRDHDAIEQALTTPHPGKPHVVVAHVEEGS
jgi:transketolase